MTTFKEFFVDMPASTATDFGVSRMSFLHECSQRAQWQAESDDEDVSGEGATIGSAMHYLMRMSPDADMSMVGITAEQEEAVRLYRAWIQFYGSLEAIGLAVHGRETLVTLAEGPTAQLDFIATVADSTLFYAATGAMVDLGALIVGDWKSAKSTRPAGYYMFGVQAQFYPTMYNRQAARHAAGILFVELVRHKQMRKIKDSKGGPSINFHYSPVINARDMTSLMAWYKQSRQFESQPIRNYGSCVDNYGKVCPFYVRCNQEIENG